MSDGNFKMEVDDSSIKEVLDKLTDDDFIKKQVLLNSLKKGGQVLREETIQKLRSKLGEGADRKSKRLEYPMTKGVRVITDKEYEEVIVSIMKDFRLKWFEKGTTERFTKGKITGRTMVGKRVKYTRDNNKVYRGKIGGLGFFGEALNQSEGAIITAINTAFENEINKLNN